MSRKNIKNFLLVYPKFPPTYWGMQFMMSLLDKKALMPSLGLITIAAMTPPNYDFRVVDLNCEAMTDEQLKWADAILFSAMLTQKDSLFHTARKCQEAGKMVIFGGPFPTACSEECRPYCDVLVLNEGEVTWPLFLKDLEDGSVKPLYTSEDKPDVTQTPCPRFDLLNMDYYCIIPLQFSRGCPFNCEFCDIIVMWGRKVRTKSTEQMLVELDALYATGYSGKIFIVDDNFIGNAAQAMKLLEGIEDWNKKHSHPFAYFTEASMNLSDNEKLLNALVKAGFYAVFLGIETPSVESLRETRKLQNVRGSLVDKIKLIQTAGLEVWGGFIIGFDNDKEDIFQRQINFIHESAVTNAMIGPIVALPGTSLYQRMVKEGRLLVQNEDHRTLASGYTNILTKIPFIDLIQGYKTIVESVYAKKAYFNRVMDVQMRISRASSFTKKIKDFWRGICILHSEITPVRRARLLKKQPSFWSEVWFIMMATFHFNSPYRGEAMWFLTKVLFRCPERYPWAIFSVYMGYHFWRFTFEHVLPDIAKKIDDESGRVKENSR